MSSITLTSFTTFDMKMASIFIFRRIMPGEQAYRGDGRFPVLGGPTAFAEPYESPLDDPSAGGGLRCCF